MLINTSGSCPPAPNERREPNAPTTDPAEDSISDVVLLRNLTSFRFQVYFRARGSSDPVSDFLGNYEITEGTEGSANMGWTTYNTKLWRNILFL